MRDPRRTGYAKDGSRYWEEELEKEVGSLQGCHGAWYGEETLDVETVHGMAPGANIVYVGAPNSFQDLDAALNNVVDKHLAQIVTNSYGFDAELLALGFIKPYEDTILQGAIEGIGIYFSSGDNSTAATSKSNHYGVTNREARSTLTAFFLTGKDENAQIVFSDQIVSYDKLHRETTLFTLIPQSHNDGKSRILTNPQPVSNLKQTMLTLQ